MFGLAKEPAKTIFFVPTHPIISGEPCKPAQSVRHKHYKSLRRAQYERCKSARCALEALSIYHGWCALLKHRAQFVVVSHLLYGIDKHSCVDLLPTPLVACNQSSNVCLSLLIFNYEHLSLRPLEDVSVILSLRYSSTCTNLMK